MLPENREPRSPAEFIEHILDELDKDKEWLADQIGKSVCRVEVILKGIDYPRDKEIDRIESAYDGSGNLLRNIKRNHKKWKKLQEE